MWATRVWWLLHSFGFRGRVSVLDGGLKAWQAAGGEIASTADDKPTPEQRRSIPRRAHSAAVAVSKRPGAFANREDVLRAITDQETTLVDSLKAGSFSGTKPSRYGRRGHITSALSVPYASVVDKGSGRFFATAFVATAAASAPRGKLALPGCAPAAASAPAIASSLS